MRGSGRGSFKLSANYRTGKGLGMVCVWYGIWFPEVPSEALPFRLHLSRSGSLTRVQLLWERKALNLLCISTRIVEYT